MPTQKTVNFLIQSPILSYLLIDLPASYFSFNPPFMLYILSPRHTSKMCIWSCQPQPQITLLCKLTKLYVWLSQTTYKDVVIEEAEDGCFISNVLPHCRDETVPILCSNRVHSQYVTLKSNLPSGAWN